MEQVIWGYVRVSTRDQNEDRQMIAMSEFDVPKDHIYMDKMSGKDFKRPAYRKLLKRMKEGHLLVIKSIDRLGRNYDEILEQWRVITKEKKVEVVVLDMPLLDTRQGRDLTGTLIADIVLQLLSYVAQTERENIRQRQAEGIAAAKLRGVKFGRPPKPVPPAFYELRRQWLDREISSRKAASSIGVAQDTFLRWVRIKPEAEGTGGLAAGEC
ncbi:recombinase family protein [Christensenella timonensis]|uniref:recombinase family protein n=1 Tax=Christensenella timonensis TaxID=1816678 RepID=UPI00082F1A77|nr:recombinase family protein [Christensenella timonensis]